MSEKDKEAISAAFDDMAMYGRGFTRTTTEGIKHIPYQEVVRPKCNPCIVCGNEFIECFGTPGNGWWVGCKPCSKRDHGRDHFHTKTEAQGIELWNNANPINGDV